MSKTKIIEKIKENPKVAISSLLLILLIILSFILKDNVIGVPVLTIETPQKVSIEETKELTLDMTISSFKDAIYPAASMSVIFDNSRLEFLRIDEGNVFIENGESDMLQKLPDWNYNAEQSNKSGKINIMYLDTTGGKNAFSKKLLGKDDNVVLRLTFRLRGSVRSGDVLDLIFEDAIFAASDEKESLGMLSKTLRVRNAKIVVTK